MKNVRLLDLRETKIAVGHPNHKLCHFRVKYYLRVDPVSIPKFIGKEMEVLGSQMIAQDPCLRVELGPPGYSPTTGQILSITHGKYFCNEQ